MRYAIIVENPSVSNSLETNDLELAKKMMRALAEVIQTEVVIYDSRGGGIIHSSKD
jgi:hypothetical protein